MSQYLTTRTRLCLKKCPLKFNYLKGEKKKGKKKESLEVVSNNLMPRKIWCSLLNQTLHWKKHFRVTKASVLPNLVLGLNWGMFFEIFLHKQTLHWKKHFRVTKASVVHLNLVFGLDLGHFWLKKLHEKRVVVVVHVPTILQHGRITFPSPL